MQNQRTKFSNKIIYFYAFYFLMKLNFYTPFFALFLEKIRDLTNNQIVMLFSVYSITIFIFELPTGLIADKYGEKISLIVGSLLTLISTIFITFGNFSFILVGEVIFGISQTFFSGAAQALLFNYIKSNKANLAAKYSFDYVLSNCVSLMWLSVALASILGHMFNELGEIYPFVGTIVVNIFLIIGSILLPYFDTYRETNLLSITNKSLYYIIKNKSLLYWSLISTLFTSTLIIGYQILQPYLNETKVSGSTNGTMYFFITLFAYLSAKFSSKISAVFKGEKSLMVFSCLLLFLVLIIFSCIKSLALIILVACIYRFIWGYISPFFIQQLNYQIKHDNLRSSILSIGSLFGNLYSFFILFIITTLNLPIVDSYIILGFLILLLGIFIVFSKLSKIEEEK